MGPLLTLERQVLAEVNLHCLLRTLCTTFGIVYHSFLTDGKADHGRVLGPVFEICGDTVLLGQDLLEDVVGCAGAHRDGGAAALDAGPGDEVADGEVMGVVWV